MRQFFLAIIGVAAAAGLLLAGVSLGQRVMATPPPLASPHPWVLWIGVADEPGSAVVQWVTAVRAFDHRAECDTAKRPREVLGRTEWVYECFPSETHPRGLR
jgi:hypothetical protein